jgi:two-component system, cell cycle response regulator
MRILIAEDERVSARQLEAVLTTWGYEVIVASNGNAAWKVLKDADAPKLAILDWMMPGKDGIELCRDIRNLRQEPYTYVVLLTEKSGRSDIVEGMNAGADDYLAKPFDAKELEARLRAGRRVLSLMDEVIAAREQLRHQATHDVLTGLSNRRAIRDLLSLELARAARQRTPVGVVMVDIDHFKQVNDTYGHIAGDAVLSEVAARMRSQMRAYDSAGRYGGEEFLLILPGCDIQSAVVKADALRALIGGTPVLTQERPINIAASMGVAVYAEDSGFAPDDLIYQADTALYQAKRNGRNCVKVMDMLQPLCLDLPQDARLVKSLASE